MSRTHATLLALGLALAAAGCASTTATDTSQASPKADAALDAAIAGSWRDAANVARDRYRHPRETLGFFQLGAGQRVIEISPSGGWYSEILAPYLRDGGHYVAATASAPADSGGGKRNAALQAKFAAAPTRYDRVEWLEYDGKAPVLGAPASADAVLTFRNVHNWVAAGNADVYFRAFFAALKPGGVAAFVDVLSPGSPLLDTYLQSVEVLRDTSHVRDYDAGQWLRQVSDAGLHVRSTSRQRLRLEYSSWVARMRTPEALCIAIRQLQQAMGQEVRDYFEIEADGSFSTDVLVLWAER